MAKFIKGNRYAISVFGRPSRDSAFTMEVFSNNDNIIEYTLPSSTRIYREFISHDADGEYITIAEGTRVHAKDVIQ